MNASLERLYRREDLEPVELESLFAQLIAGKLDPVLLTALLVTLKVKGERGSEIAAAARALRAAARPFPRPDYLFADTCGTGGDGKCTLNVSSGAALVAAACGLPVAKHGNRSVSSRSGSADVFTALGVNVQADAVLARRCLDEAGICFLHAPEYHPGIAHAMPVRRALATRTLFNLLGPLVNPAAPPCQLAGVYAPEFIPPLAEAFAALDVSHALVVHGGGLDEIALHAVTQAARISNGEIEYIELTPEAAGLEFQPVEELAGGSPQHNAEALHAMLAGNGPRAYRDAVALNTGALLWTAELVPDLRAGTQTALAAIADGRAAGVLERLRTISHGA
ncbi:MAG: anthranilate phosphoribosyltransferase [Gammaproteobacteria bacterium]|nr:anthranilate phosphoribosyltransferase [Gammaproteobacteria bacterium]MDE2345778.1 anthranilate phosphoribosyltransferase [Gammaproteobacteria bacterium]